jgi:hypothetical protein
MPRQLIQIKLIDIVFSSNSNYPGFNFPTREGLASNQVTLLRRNVGTLQKDNPHDRGRGWLDPPVASARPLTSGMPISDVIQASHANDVPPPSRSRRRSFSLVDDQAFRPEICCLDETCKGAGLALACRPAGNIAHRSTAGSDQSPARISRAISRGTESSNPSPSSSESVSRVTLSSWSRTPAFRAGFRATFPALRFRIGPPGVSATV